MQRFKVKKMPTMCTQVLTTMIDAVADRTGADDALLKKTEELDQFFSMSLDLLCVADTAGNFLRLNPEWERVLGYPAAELEGQRFLDFIHPDDIDATLAAIAKLDAQEDVLQFENRYRSRNGTYRWIEWRSHPKGKLIYAAARDITSRKQMEVYRRMGQDVLRVLNEKDSLVEVIQRVIRIVKTTTGVDAVGIRLQDEDDYPYFYQEGFSTDFLLKENSLLERTQGGGVCRDENGNVHLECTCGMVIQGRVDTSNKLWTSGGSCWTNNSFPLLHLPAEQDPRHNPRNECIHQGYASVALIPIRAKGTIVGLLHLNNREKERFTLQEIQMLEDTADNIGEALLRKQAEDKLSASERFLRTLTDQLPGMAGYWTSDLHCTFANRQYLEWFGRTKEQMMGITMQELMGEELFSKSEPYVRRVLQGEPQRFERTLVKPDGETGYTWAHYIPDMDDGKVRGFYVLVTDVTELKQAHEDKNKLEAQLQQAQKMESIGRLAGGVAHDFNNLLTVIIGRCELATLRTRPPERVMDDLSEIRIAADKSASLTQQLLAFARKQTITPKVLDLNDVIENILKMLRRLIGEDIMLLWQPAADIWQVNIDPSQIDQILANLCVNARDAITGGGRITIETRNIYLDEYYCSNHPGSTPGEYVMLAVSDDGCGMDRETMAHIFEPFFTTKGVGEGTGLGLATVYGVMKQNGGYISIYSEAGTGSTFRLYFPRHVGEAVQALVDVPVKTVLGGDETILLVEDEPAILDLTRSMLNHQGYNVLASTDPHEAVALAKAFAGDIHLLMTDVIMPEMNGCDLVRSIKAVRPDIQCLFTSGYTANVIAQRGVLDEGVQFIAKPFTLIDLAAKVRETIDR